MLPTGFKLLKLSEAA